MAQTLAQLEGNPFNAANSVRGETDSSGFKNDIFGMRFFQTQVRIARLTPGARGIAPPYLANDSRRHPSRGGG